VGNVTQSKTDSNAKKTQKPWRQSSSVADDTVPAVHWTVDAQISVLHHVVFEHLPIHAVLTPTYHKVTSQKVAETSSSSSSTQTIVSNVIVNKHK